MRSPFPYLNIRLVMITSDLMKEEIPDYEGRHACLLAMQCYLRGHAVPEEECQIRPRSYFSSEKDEVLYAYIGSEGEIWERLRLQCKRVGVKLEKGFGQIPPEDPREKKK